MFVELKFYSSNMIIIKSGSILWEICNVQLTAVHMSTHKTKITFCQNKLSMGKYQISNKMYYIQQKENGTGHRNCQKWKLSAALKVSKRVSAVLLTILTVLYPSITSLVAGKTTGAGNISLMWPQWVRTCNRNKVWACSSVWTSADCCSRRILYWK